LERIVDFTQVVVTVSLSSHRKSEFDPQGGILLRP
jgi:hypothetical protein